MKKILTIAAREYRAMVGTKAFLISVIMMPVLMLGSLFAIELLRNAAQISERKIALIDHTGQFVAAIQEEATKKNAIVDDAAAQDKLNPDAPKGAADYDVLGFTKDKYLIETVNAEGFSDENRVELSDRIRDQDLYAFVEIPNDVLEPGTEGGQAIRFYSQDSSLSLARGWISQIVNAVIRRTRLKAADIDPGIVERANVSVAVVGMSLVEKGEDGSIIAKEESDPMSAIFLPVGVMMLMFMVIFMAAQPMLESVLEEKSQRIAEVLLGSANPFQLMSGKLLGTVAGSLTVFAIYLLGAFSFATYKGWTDVVPLYLVPWFVVFQVMGVLFYASIFMAIGASVSQLKEAQAILMPVWMLMMSPMFVWLFIVRNPLSPVATFFSFFPPATPTAMMLRMATGQSIPTWQPFLGLFLTFMCTIMIVLIASRIFRVGILWQGKTPKLREILRWAVTG